jgi:hypothetical protein
VTGILPGRLATRQRLAVGTLIVAGVSLFQLIPFELWVFGSPWPIAILWAACGWTGLGISAGTSLILMGLGLWFDILTGSALGSWAVIGLATHGLSHLSSRFLGTGGASPIVNCALTGVMMICVMVVFALWQNRGIDLIGIVTPVVSAVALYFFVSRWFELFEDDT